MDRLNITLQIFGISPSKKGWQPLDNGEANLIHRLIQLGALVSSTGAHRTRWLLPDGRRLEIQSMSVRIM